MTSKPESWQRIIYVDIVCSCYAFCVLFLFCFSETISPCILSFPAWVLESQVCSTMPSYKLFSSVTYNRAGEPSVAFQRDWEQMVWASCRKKAAFSWPFAAQMHPWPNPPPSTPPPSSCATVPLMSAVGESNVKSTLPGSFTKPCTTLLASWPHLSYKG